MRVYTKTGDNGTTSLIGGKRVLKNNIRIEAYGTVDELMAYTGLLHDQLTSPADKAFFIEIQDRLMTASAMLATDTDDIAVKMPVLTNADIEMIEKAIDKIEEQLTPLRSFVLPGGHTTVSVCHIARTVCRRCERLAITVSQIDEKINIVVKYLNRLSDFYFVFSRKIAKDLNIEELLWIARK